MDQSTEVIPSRPAPQPLQIIADFIAKGGDAATVRELVLLQQDMQRFEAAKAFNRAMSLCQSEIKQLKIIKDKQGERGKYAPLETISDAIDPIITKHGFSLMFDSKPPRVEGTVPIMLDVLHVDGHTKRFEIELGLDVKGPKGQDNKTAVQGGGSTISYGRRYLKCMAFDVVPRGEDNDGSSGRQPITEEQEREIYNLLNDYKALEPTYDVSKMLKWFEVGSVREMTRRDYKMAKPDLEKKIKIAKEAKGAK